MNAARAFRDKHGTQPADGAEAEATSLDGTTRT